MKKKIFTICLVFLCILSICINSYNTVKASEIAVAGGGVAVGVGLLSLLALTGVGATIYGSNDISLSDLSDEQINKLENGLANSYEDACLQNGIANDKVRKWLDDVSNGVLDKANECWDFFKDWVKDLTISDIQGEIEEDGHSVIGLENFIGASWRDKQGNSYTFSRDWYDFVMNWAGANVSNVHFIGYFCYGNNICFIKDNNKDYVGSGANTSCFITYTRGSGWAMSGYSEYLALMNSSSVRDNVTTVVCSKPIYFPDTSTNINGLGVTIQHDLLKTNTDYLERLQGKDKERVEVIDVTDIKHPIIESLPNTKAEISYNRGTNNNRNNNDDDEETYALVPTDIWYESLDDYWAKQRQAVIDYDNTISDTPENEQEKVYISTAPVSQIYNYFNVLPVVNYPIPCTVVNNNYEYNNIDNRNITIYEAPYNTDLVPTFFDVFQNKFPFCIPWDIYSFVVMLSAEREAPQITIPFPYITENGLATQDIVLSLADYEYVSTVLRVMFFLAFVVGLALITRQLIKG